MGRTLLSIAFDFVLAHVGRTLLSDAFDLVLAHVGQTLLSDAFDLVLAHVGRTLLSDAFDVGVELGSMTVHIDVLLLTRIAIFFFHKQKRRSQ